MQEKSNKNVFISTIDKAKAVGLWLHEKKAQDILALDISEVCSVTEAMVVASAKTARHAKALADAVMERCGELKLSCFGMEGYKNGQWVLVDLNDVLVHIFLEDVREFYNIEGLWSEGKPIELDLPQDGEA